MDIIQNIEDPKKTWTVVLFETDESVEAIPTSWLTSPTECIYPPFTGHKVLQAIKNLMELDTCWPTFKVRPFRNATYGDYTVARQKCIKAQETSELSSENDGIKRRKIQKMYSSESEDSGEFSLKDPPKAPSKILNLPRKVPTKLKSSSKQLRKPERAVQEPIEEPTSPVTPPSHYRLNSHSNASTFKEDGLTCPSPTPLGTNSLAENPVAKNNLCSTCGHYLQEILQVQYFNKQILKDILMEVRSNKGKTGTPIHDNSLHKKFSLPLHCESDFDQLNGHLNDTDNFNSAVDEICLLGGHNNYDFVRRSLSMIMTNDLALLYIWLGRRDKKAFCSLNIARVIIEAASRNKKAMDIKETENSIASWLRRAGDRKKNIKSTN